MTKAERITELQGIRAFMATREFREVLAKEHGLLWLTLHCHWLARVKVFASLLFIFGCGVQAAQNQDFIKVWTWIIAPITFASKLLTK